MDHRTTSQEASPNGHQNAESAAPIASLAERIRYHIAIRGGPSKDENGNYIGTSWPMMLEAAEELTAAYERIAKLEADLHECREYIEQEVDVVDGDYGQPAPNRAMQLVTMIDESLNGRVQ